MNGNPVFLRCMPNEDSPERISAREYLLIPLSKKVYIVMTEGATSRSVISICESIAHGESGDLAIYVFCSRESGLDDLIKETFGGDSPVKPVVIGNKTGMYISAADVIISANQNVAQDTSLSKAAFIKVYKRIGSAISAAKRFVNAKKKAKVSDA